MITGLHIRAARAIFRWSVEEFAKRANVGIMTILRAEAVDGESSMLPDNGTAVRAALESVGVIFTPTDGEGPGVKPKKAT